MALLDRLPRQARYGVQLAGAACPQMLRPLVLVLASHRPIREVLPGVHHRTAIHPRIRLPVDSYYIEPARILLDPMVPREGLEWFEQRETSVLAGTKAGRDLSHLPRLRSPLASALWLTSVKFTGAAKADPPDSLGSPRGAVPVGSEAA